MSDKKDHRYQNKQVNQRIFSALLSRSPTQGALLSNLKLVKGIISTGSANLRKHRRRKETPNISMLFLNDERVMRALVGEAVHVPRRSTELT